MATTSGAWIRLTKNPAVWKRTFAPGITGFVRRVCKINQPVSYVWTLYRDKVEIACATDTYLPRAKCAVEIALRQAPPPPPTHDASASSVREGEDA